MRILITLLICCSTSLSFSQTPMVLDGLAYRGTTEATHQQGCEGCGNPGHVEFREDGFLDFTLPGSDIIESGSYKRSGNTLRIADSKWTMELKGDTLFFTAYDYRHVYLRVRE